MPQGLQCWDASGALIVDLTDKQLTLFARITVQDAIGAGVTVSSYFGSSGIGSILTLNGIDPSNTVAFLGSSEVGTATNSVNMIDATVLITAANKYVMARMERSPAATDPILFYKFR